MCVCGGKVHGLVCTKPRAEDYRFGQANIHIYCVYYVDRECIINTKTKDGSEVMFRDIKNIKNTRNPFRRASLSLPPNIRS